MRVLLVDDEEEVRAALAEILVSQGHEVVPADGGPDALRLLEEDGRIELVITDLVMPTTTGWELADAVKARRPGLPVGVVTGRGDVPEAGPATRPSVEFVLAKPVTLEALAEAIGRLPAR
jgi:DNA-binding NtrC family response regulator